MTPRRLPAGDNRPSSSRQPVRHDAGILRDGDFTLADSSAIVHYMEAIKPDPY